VIGVCRAVVLATSPGTWQVVGGLPLGVRALLTLRAAGIAELLLFGASIPDSVRRLLDRRGVEVRWLATPEDARDLGAPDPVLVLAGDVLFDVEVVAPVLAAARSDVLRVAIAADRSAGEVHAAICPGTALPTLLTELGGGTRSLTDAIGRVGAALGPAAPMGPGLFVPLDLAHPPAALERALLDHLARRTTADSYLAPLIDRRLSRPLTRLLLDWPVTPSQITLASLLVGLLGAAGLATVSYAGRLCGLLALVASIVLDCVDGELARARFEQSAAGARLDVIGDYAVNLATFVGLGIGLARQGLPPAGVWATVGLVGGVAAAMATVHALFVRPALTRGGDLHWSGDADSLRGTPVGAVVEKLASRDYTYVLLVLALVGHLEWFLYAAAAGSWAFVAGLIGYWTFGGSARRRQVASQ